MVHGVVATLAGTLLLVGSESEATPVVSAPSGIAALEADVAHAPTTESLASLTSAYLERNQPGLAQALLDAHPELDSAELTHQRARVALAEGEVDRALSLSRLSLAMCEDHCPAGLTAKALRQISTLEAMERAGIRDPSDDPAATRAALAQSNREVRLAVAP
ncbi:MAG TPA: hypothetical protein VL400_08825 [Polyangiaceae bacterium]|nr:hypothetical protein [Polyangiaceae bacterium]